MEYISDEVDTSGSLYSRPRSLLARPRLATSQVYLPDTSAATGTTTNAHEYEQNSVTKAYEYQQRTNSRATAGPGAHDGSVAGMVKDGFCGHNVEYTCAKIDLNIAGKG